MVEVTAPIYRRSPVVVVHRGNLARRDRAPLRGIPVTGVAHTLADLGAVVTEERVEAALESALRRRLVKFDDLLVRLDDLGGRGRRGVGTLRVLLDDRRLVPTESELERALDRVLAWGKFFPAERQFPVFDGQELRRLDFAYPELMLAIEAESYQWHLDKNAFESDLARRNRLLNLGWHVLYFTWGQISRRNHEIWRDVADALQRRRASLRA